MESLARMKCGIAPGINNISGKLLKSATVKFLDDTLLRFIGSGEKK